MRKDMKDALVPWACALLVAAASGCSITRTETRTETRTVDYEGARGIREGTTTRADVEALLGPPARVERRDDGGEEWTYVSREASGADLGLFSRSESTENTFTVRFDPRGVVEAVGHGTSYRRESSLGI
jgi:outer membrane protein assembly factor BamE (lipoprotein component of BamABCDE complex)